MEHTAIAQLLAGAVAPGQQVNIKGWVRTRRSSKGGFSFISVNDGSCFGSIQAVAANELANYQSDVEKISAGCSVSISGQLVASQGKGQAFEIQATEVTVIGWVEDPESYPISPKNHSFEYLRSQAHLRPRTNTFGAITRVRNCVAQATHRYFHEQGFYWVNTPILTTSDCEGAGDLFRVSTLDLQNLPRNEQQAIDFEQDFFGKETFLAVSGQLNVETHCLALSKVYTFGPTFRAENSNTSRHLAEFWMVEPEIAFSDLNDTAALAESYLKYVFKAVLNERQDDMDFFNQRIDKTASARLQQVAEVNFEHMEYDDAITLLQNSKVKFAYPVEWGLDLQSEHERYLTEKLVGKPIVLKNYPKDIKAFYMRLNDDQRTVAAMDVLAPGIGEIIGGSQREERLDVLDLRLQAQGLSEELWWYRDLRRYGTVPHAGFGLGLERLINYITGMDNIRDAIPFPRTPKHAAF